MNFGFLDLMFVGINYLKWWWLFGSLLYLVLMNSILKIVVWFILELY